MNYVKCSKCGEKMPEYRLKFLGIPICNMCTKSK